jgi:uncharacterized protein (TIRG00374 family)
VTTRPRRFSKLFPIRLILWAIGLGLLGHVLWANRGSFREVFGHRPDPRYLALAYLLCLLGLTSTFVRWYVVVRSQGMTFRLRDAVKIGFLGNAVDLIVPAQVGGDVLKAAYLCRLQPRRTRAIAAIMIDRAIGVLGLLLLASLMGAMRWPASGPTVRRLIQLVWCALAMASAALATVFIPGSLRPFERLGAHHERLRRVLAELNAMGMAYRGRKAGLALSLAMSVGSHSLYALSFAAVSQALLPHAPTLLEHLQMVPLVLFTTIVPLPFGALGLSEQVSHELFWIIGYPLGSLAMMGFRVVSLAVSGVSILVYLANSQSLPSHASETIPELAERG